MRCVTWCGDWGGFLHSCLCYCKRMLHLWASEWWKITRVVCAIVPRDWAEYVFDILHICRQSSFRSKRECVCLCVNEREGAYSEWFVGCVCIKAHSSDCEWMSSLCCASNLLCLACRTVDLWEHSWSARTHTHTHHRGKAVYAMTPRGLSSVPGEGCYQAADEAALSWLHC